MSQFRSPARSKVGGAARSPLSGGSGLRLPSTNLLAKWPAPPLVDSIGLSVSDSLLVPAELRSIFFIDAQTMRSSAEIIASIKTSPYLNISELVGNSKKGFALYVDGTAVAALQKACKFFGVTYGTYLGADFDGNTITGTPDIGAFEYQG